MKEIVLKFEDTEYEYIKCAYAQGKRENESLEEYLQRAIIFAAKTGTGLKDKVRISFAELAVPTSSAKKE